MFILIRLLKTFYATLTIIKAMFSVKYGKKAEFRVRFRKNLKSLLTYSQF